MKSKIFACLFLIITLNAFSCKTLENKIRSFADDDVIATITSDNEDEFLEAVRILNMNGGTIYIDTPILSITNTTSKKWSFF